MNPPSALPKNVKNSGNPPISPLSKKDVAALGLRRASRGCLFLVIKLAGRYRLNSQDPKEGKHFLGPWG